MTSAPARCYAVHALSNMLTASRVDSHQHLWRYTPEEFGWIDDSMAMLRRDFLLSDLRHELQTANVSATVAVQARQTLEETDWLLSLAEESSSPISGVVGWLPLAAPDIQSRLEEFADRPALKGLRHIVQAESAGFLEGKAFNKGIRAMRDADLVYDILVTSGQLPEVIRFVDQHPDQPFVLDHIAKPAIRTGEFEPWAANIRELARRPNVTCKLSGMVTEADFNCWTAAQLEPYFDVVVDSFGPNRLMIGTDWPVLAVGCTYAQWWRIVEQWVHPLTQQEQVAILGGTAARVYNLKPPDTSANKTQVRPE